MFGKATKTANVDAVPRPTFSDADIAKARSWFQKGQELAQKKNYDYAIESYISGLQYWPDAVEEGHKPCWAAALFRGSKKASFTDTLKYKTGGKDPKEAMLNAERLLTKEPGNIGYMEALFKNAARAGYLDTVMWIGELLADAAAREAKPSVDRLAVIRATYERIGDQYQNDKPPIAIKALERAVQALTRLLALKPQDMTVSTDLRDVSGKLTILKGKYGSSESFIDSVKDKDLQRELHDRDLMVRSDDRVEEMLTEARRRFQANQTDRAAINDLANLLTSRDNPAEEKEAILLLADAAERTGEYSFRMRADDLRIRRGQRRLRKADAAMAPKIRSELLHLELQIYQDRCKRYPTDMRLRYQYGVRLFQVGRYDEAIPTLQDARNDPKARAHALLYIGRCFYAKEYYAQAIETFKEAIAMHEPPDDKLGQDLHWRLAESYRAEGRIDDALKTYGQLIQWDYNYRKGEARQRIDALKKGGASDEQAVGQ